MEDDLEKIIQNAAWKDRNMKNTEEVLKDMEDKSRRFNILLIEKIMAENLPDLMKSNKAQIKEIQ